MSSFDSKTGDESGWGRRKAAMIDRQMLIESGTDDDEPEHGTKRRQKALRKSAAKRVKVEPDDVDAKFGPDLTEKERELKIFKHIEEQEILRIREEIEQKLMGNAVANESRIKAEISEKDPQNSSSNVVVNEHETKSDDDNETSSSESSASDSEDSDNEADDSKTQQGEEVNCFEQLNRIRLSRFKLAKLCHAPFFDKMVVGCFVRINVGLADGQPVYRAAQIIEALEGPKAYDFEGTRTNKALLLKHGPDERVWRMEFVSNSPITNNEYFKWRDAMKNSKLMLPTTMHIEKKWNDIDDALNYQFTDADVTKMVEQRQRFINVPTKYALYKAELMKLKIDAEQSGNSARCAELQREIIQVDDAHKKKTMEQTRGTVSVNIINQRNREAQQRALIEKSRRNPAVNNEDDVDPFTRKSARMRVVTGFRKKDGGSA